MQHISFHNTYKLNEESEYLFPELETELDTYYGSKYLLNTDYLKEDENFVEFITNEFGLKKSEYEDFYLLEKKG